MDDWKAGDIGICISLSGTCGVCGLKPDHSPGDIIKVIDVFADEAGPGILIEGCESIIHCDEENYHFGNSPRFYKKLEEHHPDEEDQEVIASMIYSGKSLV